MIVDLTDGTRFGRGNEIVENKSERGKTEFLIQFIKFTTIITVLSVYPYIAAQTGPPAQEEEPPSMRNTSMFDLFYDQLFRIGKVDGRLVRAAVELVAREGDWKRVLVQLDQRNGPPERSLTILGLIAQDHAGARKTYEAWQKGGYPSVVSH